MIALILLTLFWMKTFQETNDLACEGENEIMCGDYCVSVIYSGTWRDRDFMRNIGCVDYGGNGYGTLDNRTTLATIFNNECEEDLKDLFPGEISYNYNVWTGLIGNGDPVPNPTSWEDARLFVEDQPDFPDMLVKEAGKNYWTVFMTDSGNEMYWNPTRRTDTFHYALCQYKIPTCHGFKANDKKVCHGRGFCYRDDVCTCIQDDERNPDHYGRFGGNCQYECYETLEDDPNVCTGNGVCTGNNCHCNDGAFGNKCDIMMPDGSLKYNGEGENNDYKFTLKFFCQYEQYFDNSTDCKKIFPLWDEQFGCEARCVVGYYYDDIYDTNIASKIEIFVYDEEAFNIQLLGEGKTVRIKIPETETIMDIPIDWGEDSNWWRSWGSQLAIIGGTSVGVICAILLLITAVVGGIIVIIMVIGAQKRKNKSLGETKGDVTTKEDFSLLEMDELDKKEHAKFKINKDLFKIAIKDIRVKKSIGKGGYSVIYLAYYSNIYVAFKSFDTRMLADDQNDFDMFEKELMMFSSLRHPNIPNFYGASLAPPRCGIVMEYCPDGDLTSYLPKMQLEIPKVLEILKQISNGMDYLHSKKLIHRDLKPENILITNGIPKITDFGVSRFAETKEQTKTHNVGTSLYMAPEMCTGQKYDNSVDVFAYGIMIWCCCTTTFKPYGENISAFNIQMKVASQDLRPSLDAIPKNVYKNYKWVVELMKKCWDKEPSVRPSFKEIYAEFESNGI